MKIFKVLSLVIFIKPDFLKNRFHLLNLGEINICGEYLHSICTDQQQLIREFGLASL